MVFIFIFIPPAPFAHPRPSKTKSAISLSQKIKSILRLANSYRLIQPSTRQLLKRSIFTGTRYPSCTKQSDDISRQIGYLTNPTLTSNFPLGLFFFLFHLINHVCCRSRTRPLVCLLSPPHPTQATHLIQIRWERKPPPAENWDLGQRLTFVM